MLATPQFTAVLRAEAIPIAIASLVGEGATDSLIIIPTGEGLGLVLSVAVVALIAAYIAIDVICKMVQAN